MHSVTRGQIETGNAKSNTRLSFFLLVNIVHDYHQKKVQLEAYSTDEISEINRRESKETGIQHIDIGMYHVCKQFSV